MAHLECINAGEIEEACPRCANGTFRSSGCVMLGVVTTYYGTSVERQRVGYEGNKAKSMTCAELHKSNYRKASGLLRISVYQNVLDILRLISILFWNKSGI